MTTKEKLVWRLTKLPTTEELRELVKDKIISQDEAREILFSTDTQEERDGESLKAEIKFLRELVERLAQNQTSKIIETIKYVEKPYYNYGWYRPYEVWCSGTSNITTGSVALYSTTTDNNATNCSFTNLSTF